MSGKTTGGPRAAHTANHAERAHAVFAPSAAERWINCPDSIRAQEGMKDTPSAAALEGTQCHEAASAILEGETFSRATRNLTNEQTILVSEYVDAVEGKFDAVTRSDHYARMIVEQRMRAPLLHPDYHGTGDGLIVSRDTLHVDDLKCGYSPVAVRYPDGRLNSQLGSYVLLALAHLGVIVSPWVKLDPETIGIRRIFLTVHQPRVYDRPETTRVSIPELQEFLDTIVEAIERVESGDRTRKAGEWCKFCLALGRCPTARNAANEKAKADFSVGVENYTLDEMAEILQEAGWLERQLKGAKATVFNALRVGRDIEGSKLVAKKGRKRWVDWDEAQAIGAELGFGISDLYKMEPISPAQFIALIRAKRLGRKFEWKEFNACYVSESSGYTLVPADDPRPAAEIRPGDDFPDDLPGDDD